MKSAQRAGTLRNGVAVTDADVVTGYASQRLLWIGIVTDRECKPLTFGLFDNVACLNDSDADYGHRHLHRQFAPVHMMLTKSEIMTWPHVYQISD